jgi:uncharacterized membrane protein
MVKPENEGSGATGLESSISYVLITGVVVSLILEIVGIILYYRQTGTLAISERHALFIQGNDFFSFFTRLVYDTAKETTGLRLMAIGITVLILTPYVRAVMSVIYFAEKKNVKYTIFTLFVMAILTASLMMH